MVFGTRCHCIVTKISSQISQKCERVWKKVISDLSDQFHHRNAIYSSCKCVIQTNQVSYETNKTEYNENSLRFRLNSHFSITSISKAKNILSTQPNYQRLIVFTLFSKCEFVLISILFHARFINLIFMLMKILQIICIWFHFKISITRNIANSTQVLLT